MEINQYIEVDAKIMMGKPVIKGTRITVEQILEQLSVINSIDEMLQSYPHLNKDQVHAAIAFAADSIKGDEIYPIAI
jgi:uncharacterized protein (DUF433 family)